MFYNTTALQNRASSMKNLLPMDSNAEIHRHGSDYFPMSQQIRSVPLNRFNFIRIKSLTQLQAQPFVNGSQMDFDLSCGFTEKLLLELTLNITTAPVSLNLEYLIDRIEFLGAGDNILSTVRGQNLYHAWLTKKYDQSAREVSSVNKDINFVSQSIPVSNGNVFYIHLWSFIDYCQPKLDAIKNRIKLRIYFSGNGIIAGSASNITATQIDLIAQTQQIAPSLDTIETNKKLNSCLKFRYLEPVRGASESRAMLPSTEYNFRLSSANGPCAFILFQLTPIGGLPDAFQEIANYEFLDSNNTIVGINTSKQLQQYVGDSLSGYISTIKPGMYCIPFAFPELALNGNSAGYYGLSTIEQIKILTPSTLVAGNFLFEAFCYSYQTIIIEKGVVSVQK